MSKIKIIECPRDAMQGMGDFVKTQFKIDYINSLLKCGFDTIDFGSFVSPKAIPQMKDTAEVLKGLELNNDTKLLAIVANERGATDAINFDEVNYLGFPFSVSETFQQRNTNSSIEDSLKTVERIQSLAINNSKELVVYLSMGFGNPYGDDWNADIVINWSKRLYEDLGVKILALSDTIGSATNDSVDYLFSALVPELTNVEFGAHLHTTKAKAKSIIESAFNSGCRRFDGAIKGFGGCPMAKDDLTGNMPTELMLEWFSDNQIDTGVDKKFFTDSFSKSSLIFN